ncbi:FUSC family protein [Massilia sp. LXY-6]|uniref:FUSC family protein n=1 Tax=Massilia sp. LXY-6 TaxID=3379823 RepID=UPI003EDF3EED
MRAFLANEARQATTVRASDRVWQMPFAAALASGLPLPIGAYFGHLDYGLVSATGGLAFLYLPATPLSHRMVSLMACAFGMVACYTLGAISHLYPPSILPALVAIAILVTMTCRAYDLGPPNSIFFVMAAAIGAYAPSEAAQLPLKVGLFTLGCLLACVIGFFYSVYMLRRREPRPVPHAPAPDFDDVVVDSIVIGMAVCASLAAAQALGLDKPYWVPVSCLAVIQGVSFRAVWNKQVHRVLGTGLGLILSWALLSIPMDQWSLSVAVMLLTFLIEMLVVRHYALATMFITPLAILLADAATLDQGSPAALVRERFFDTVLGCAMGLAGALCLHHERFRRAAGRQLRRLLPVRRAP